MDSLTTIITEEGEFRVRMDHHGTFWLRAETPEEPFPDEEIELLTRPKPWPPAVGQRITFFFIGPMLGMLPIPVSYTVDVAPVREYTMVEPLPREGASGPPCESDS